jgi:thioredoxin reductase (NADPH)
MFDWDAIIIGGGPAGLTAGIYLSRARVRTLLLEGESYGGKIKNLESIENYSGFGSGISGAQLATEMQNQAVKFGLNTEPGRVTGLEIYSGSKCVICDDGRSYTTAAVIFAGGSVPRKLGVPGEDALYGKGVFTCAFCDGGEFADKIVAVCGGGDAGITEALYMAKIASKVIVFEAMPAITACAILQERAASNPKLEVHCGTKVTAITGSGKVEGIEFSEAGGQKGAMKVDGVLVHIGLVPNTDYLPGNIPLDKSGCIVVNEKMETEIPLVLAAGDIRSGSPGQVSTAVGDGATAAISAIKQLQQQKLD